MRSGNDVRLLNRQLTPSELSGKPSVPGNFRYLVTDLLGYRLEGAPDLVAHSTQILAVVPSNLVGERTGEFDDDRNQGDLAVGAEDRCGHRAGTERKSLMV